MTDLSTDAQALEALKKGVGAILQKPFFMADLSKTVKQVLGH